MWMRDKMSTVPTNCNFSCEASAVSKASELKQGKRVQEGKRWLQDLFTLPAPVEMRFLRRPRNLIRAKGELPALFNHTGECKQADESVSVLLSKQVQSGVLMEKIIRKLIELGLQTLLK